jgi:hypothetical protein
MALEILPQMKTDEHPQELESKTKPIDQLITCNAKAVSYVFQYAIQSSPLDRIMHGHGDVMLNIRLPTCQPRMASTLPDQDVALPRQRSYKVRSSHIAR